MDFTARLLATIASQPAGGFTFEKFFSGLKFTLPLWICCSRCGWTGGVPVNLYSSNQPYPGPGQFAGAATPATTCVAPAEHFFLVEGAKTCFTGGYRAKQVPDPHANAVGGTTACSHPNAFLWGIGQQSTGSACVSLGVCRHSTAPGGWSLRPRAKGPPDPAASSYQLG